MSLPRGSGALVLAVWLALPAAAQSRHPSIEGMWSNPPAIPVGRLCAFCCTDHAIVLGSFGASRGDLPVRFLRRTISRFVSAGTTGSNCELDAIEGSAPGSEANSNDRDQTRPT
jgi:hypothetical protein